MMKTLFSLTLLILIADIISAFKIPQFWPERYESSNLQRIVGGQNATRYQFPHQVVLYTNPSGAFCGGSVISATCALTAAHCIYQSANTVNPYTDVVFGILNIDDTSSAEPDRILQTATSVLPHASFRPWSPRYDIGLVFYSALTLGGLAIVPIALPSDDTDLYEEDDVIISG